MKFIIAFFVISLLASAGVNLGAFIAEKVQKAKANKMKKDSEQ